MNDRSNTPDARGDSPRDGNRSIREEADLPQRDAGGREQAGRVSPRVASGPTISGRSFAGASMASDLQEQTRDHRGESQRHELDAGGSRSDESQNGDS